MFFTFEAQIKTYFCMKKKKKMAATAKAINGMMNWYIKSRNKVYLNFLH